VPGPPPKRNYYFLYPTLGLEVGKNLNRPSTLAGTPVDLSHFNAIVRGLLGADAGFARTTPDQSSDQFSFVGHYRVRLPAFDEPFINTAHGVTAVGLTAKSRNWVEVDLDYTPEAFKYFGLNVKYQFGSLPPLFSFVDHKVSVGVTFKAYQTSKPSIPAQ
jgi:hypothetical protein